MAKQVTNRQGFWTPLPISSPHDELGRLAETFNQLLQGVDSAVRQLRQFVTDASHELRTRSPFFTARLNYCFPNPGVSRNIRKPSSCLMTSSRS